MLFLPALAKADSFVQVDMSASALLFNETVAVSLVWDTTTNVLSDIDITSTGPWGMFSTTPNFLTFAPRVDNPNNPVGMAALAFLSPGGTVFMEEIFISSLNPILPAPGVYVTQTVFFCSASNSDPNCGGTDVGDSLATVTAISTPEPNTLALLGAGLVALGLVVTLFRGAPAKNFVVSV
jgi:hypothetical protein